MSKARSAGAADHLWLLPASLASVLLVGIALNAAIGWESAGILTGAFQPDSVVTVALLAGLLTLTQLAYWGPRRRQARESFLAPLIAAAVVATALGLASFGPCVQGQSPVLAPSTWTLLLFAGEMETSPFEPGAICAGPLPLALQIARFLALAVTVVGAVGAAVTVWRDQIRTLRVRFLADVDVVIGVSDEALPIIEALLEQDSTPKRHRVVVLHPDPSSGAARHVTSLGALCIGADPESRDEMREILTRAGRRATRRLYALSESAPLNRAICSTAREILDGAASSADIAASVLTARIDDPRQAEAWRMRNALRPSATVLDAICAPEGIADAAVRFLTEKGVRQLVIVGGGPLLPTLLGALAARRGAAGALLEADSGKDEPVDLPFPQWRGLEVHVLTASPDAAREWELLEPRSRTRSPIPALNVTFASDSTQPHALTIRRALAGDGIAGVIFIDLGDPQVEELASRAARILPDAWILAPAPGSSGESVAEESSHDRLVGLDLRLLGPGGSLPRGGWESLAELQHEVYRHAVLSARDEPRVTQLPWPELSEEVRQDNLAQLRQLFVRFAELGYEWTTDGGRLAGEEEPDEAAMLLAARSEHERWLSSKRARGYVFGPVTDDSATPPTNALLLAWEELPGATRDRNARQIRAITERAAIFGLRPRRVVDRATTPDL